MFAFAFDGIFIGATWSRDMRNLMLLSLLIYLATWFALQPFGNAGLWGALDASTSRVAACRRCAIRRC